MLKEPQEVKEVNLRWEAIENYCFNFITSNNWKRGQFKNIVAVARGGLIPAVILSHQLGIRNFHTVNITTYEDGIDGNRVRIPSLSEGEKAKLKELEDILLVEDVIDSGRTIEYLSTILRPETTIFTLTAKRTSIEKYQHLSISVGRIVEDSDWVIFPWEC